jgi:ADP-heptose:LPS heptosyltransferase
LAVTDSASNLVSEKLEQIGFDGSESIAMIHPTAAFDTKQWSVEKFARVSEEIRNRGLAPVVVVAPHEKETAEVLIAESSANPAFLSDLSLPEVTALAARAKLFVGNDSGIAHIAATAGAPCVVVFGSSNRHHWRPWTTEPNEIVFEELPCQPCHGYFCAEFEKPECILRVPVERVIAAVDRILNNTKAVVEG